MNYTLKLKSCPFCGKQMDLNDPDTIYPCGAWKKDSNGDTHYLSYNSPNIDGFVFGIYCEESSGGCGAQISGDSIEEVIFKWNRRKLYES